MNNNILACDYAAVRILRSCVSCVDAQPCVNPASLRRGLLARYKHSLAFPLSHLSPLTPHPSPLTPHPHSHSLLSGSTSFFITSFMNPVEIIPRLYLSSEHASQSMEVLSINNITHIVNMAHECKNYFPKGILLLTLFFYVFLSSHQFLF